MKTKEEKLKRQREINKAYRERHKERLALEKKQYLIDNPEQRRGTTARYRQKTKPQMEQRKRENFALFMFQTIRTRSRKRGLDFDLAREDFIIPERCPYLKVPLTRIVGQGRHDFNPSVDRIDPAKGYVRGNIEVISDKANRMKNNASKEELLMFAEEILVRYKDSHET